MLALKMLFSLLIRIGDEVVCAREGVPWLWRGRSCVVEKVAVVSSCVLLFQGCADTADDHFGGGWFFDSPLLLLRYESALVDFHISQTDLI